MWRAKAGGTRVQLPPPPPFRPGPRAAETRSRFDRAFRGLVHPSEVWCSRGIVPRSVQTALCSSRPGKDSPAPPIRLNSKCDFDCPSVVVRFSFDPLSGRPARDGTTSSPGEPDPERSQRHSRGGQAVVRCRSASSRCRDRSQAKPIESAGTKPPRERSGAS